MVENSDLEDFAPLFHDVYSNCEGGSISGGNRVDKSQATETSQVTQETVENTVPPESCKTAN